MAQTAPNVAKGVILLIPNPKPQGIKHDGQLAIATGRSRKETDWKNRQLSWSELLVKLSQTVYTPETVAEYDALPKSQQDEIKDVGGLVGGPISGGKRKTGAVSWRHLLTLDADFATTTFWDDFTLFNDFAACVYSTHKHRPGKPRLRLIIPLSRPVSPDEYQALARKVAQLVGIDLFDDTTYQPQRLMYWPSTSADGEFYFRLQDGPWLDPDEMLAQYGPGEAWKDQALWPESSRTHSQRQKAAAKQGDPLEKPGIVGAFCRTYTIQEAIETFLADVYEPCAIEGRYTYSAGSSAGGLVLYEDKFAFSHHGTDPISGRLVNSFDLVRLHNFGELDNDVEPGTPSNKLPSYRAMIDLAVDDPLIKKTLGQEKLADAQTDFAAMDAADADAWLARMEIDRTGGYKSSPANVLLILEHDQRLAGKVALDDFAHRVTVRENLPWRKAAQGRYWGDADDAGLRNYLHKIYGIKDQRVVADALSEALFENTLHPVKEYLTGLAWDGVPRIDALLVDYLGAEDSEYTRAVTRKMLTAAVARVMNPGCKFDNMLVMVGPQGIGKSYLLKKLGREWFSDSLTTVQGKEAYEQLQGAWILEVGELSAMRRAEVEAVKHFLSKQIDSFRVAYGRHISIFPRQCVFFGSTNKEEFLVDKTGNRRFWPVKTRVQPCTRDLFAELTEEEINQIWAEAMAAWRAGEPLFLDSRLTEQALIKQEQHMEESEKFGPVLEYLDRKLPADWEQRDLYQRRAYLTGGDFGAEPEGTVERSRVCALEVWCEVFGGDQKTFTMTQQREVKDILRRVPGWKDYGGKKLRFGRLYGPQRAFTREG